MLGEEQSVLALFRSRSKGFWIGLSILLSLSLGWLDYITGTKLSFSLLYLLPVSCAAWFVGRRFGILISLLCALAGITSDVISGFSTFSTGATYWNFIMRSGVFVIATELYSRLKQSLYELRILTQTDYLTGALNARAFHERLVLESQRSDRYKHPFSLAYIDLDNFKTVNDTQGHGVGDQVLHDIVAGIKQHSRKSDVLARLGGDEFALLLPETNQVAAIKALENLRSQLLKRMQQQGWPITFSIGVVTCEGSCLDREALIKAADALMYEVKHSGKNNIKLKVIA